MSQSFVDHLVSFDMVQIGFVRLPVINLLSPIIYYDVYD